MGRDLPPEYATTSLLSDTKNVRIWKHISSVRSKYCDVRNDLIEELSARYAATSCYPTARPKTRMMDLLQSLISLSEISFQILLSDVEIACNRANIAKVLPEEAATFDRRCHVEFEKENLSRAERTESLRLVRTLILQRADPNNQQVDRTQISMLSNAVDYDCSLDMIRLLLRFGTDTY